MLLPEQVHRLFQLALVEFAPDWEISGACTELSLHKAEHWASGLGTFGLVLHNRATGATKVLGRRTGESPHASYHRGISYAVFCLKKKKSTQDTNHALHRRPRSLHSRP